MSIFVELVQDLRLGRIRAIVRRRAFGLRLLRDGAPGVGEIVPGGDLLLRELQLGLDISETPFEMLGEAAEHMGHHATHSAAHAAAHAARAMRHAAHAPAGAMGHAAAGTVVHAAHSAAAMIHSAHAAAHAAAVMAGMFIGFWRVALGRLRGARLRLAGIGPLRGRRAATRVMR